MSMNDTFQTETLEHVVLATLGSGYDTLDGSLVKQAEEHLLAAVSDSSCTTLVVDMSHTRFFGSAFIESLIRVWNVLKPRPQSSLKLCGLQPYCEEVLTITHLNQIWGIYETPEQAIEAATCNSASNT